MIQIRNSAILLGIAVLGYGLGLPCITLERLKYSASLRN
jgi:hypothetical protein